MKQVVDSSAEGVSAEAVVVVSTLDFLVGGLDSVSGALRLAAEMF